MQKALSLFGMTVPLAAAPTPPLISSGPGDQPTYHYDEHHHLLRVEFPDGSGPTYTYDDDHHLIRHQTAAGHSRDFTYDDQHRLRAIADDQGNWATYATGSHRAQFATATSQTLIEYDAQNRPLKITQTIQAVTLSTEYAYSATGQCIGIRLPGSTQWLDYATDDANQISQMRAEQGMVYVTIHPSTAPLATPSSSPKTPRPIPSQSLVQTQILNFANGIREEREISTTGQINNIAIITANASAINLSYQFNQQLQIEQIEDNCFKYDAEGRLIHITTNQSFTHYTYDEWGNRLSVATPQDAKYYQYDDCHRLIDIRSAHTIYNSYQYDRDGNRISQLTNDVLTEYRYNSNGQLTEVWRDQQCLVQYDYDALDRRIQKIANGITTFYYYDLHGQLLAETDERGQVQATYLWLGTRCLGRIAGTVGAPVAQFYHTDHLGSAWAVSDRDGTLTQFPWQPFGETASPLFTRKFRDPITGFYDFGARDYDPATGRFLTPDPYTFAPDDWRLLVDPQRDVWGDRPSPQTILDQWQTQPQLQNRYAFCLNDPVNHIDLDGHSAWWFFLTIPTSLTWGMPNTSLALVLLVLNLVMEILGWILFPFMCIANKQAALEHYPWGNHTPPDNPFNPKERAHFWFGLTASARLGVPWTILNGSFFVWRPYTLGNVVFIQSNDDNGHAGDVNSRFVVPKDIDTQLSRQDALRNHEMQHTFQYDLLGPLFLIVYVISLLASGQSKSYFERNAGANSGDVYRTLLEAEKTTIYVGQFTRVMGADPVPLGTALSVVTVNFTITPAAPVGPATASGNLDPNQPPHQIKLNVHNTAPVQVVNGSAFYFQALQAGTYQVEGTGSLRGETETVEIKVKDVEVELKNNVFICESQTIDIDGDSSATYSLRIKTMNSSGSVNGLIYTAGNTDGIDTLEVMAKYQPTLEVFKAYGDNGLTAHNYLVKTITITVKEPTITPNTLEVFVGGEVNFTIDHPPNAGSVNAPPQIAGSQFNLQKKRFTAGKGPIAAEVTETVTLTYACKSYPFTIKVKPITATSNPATVVAKGTTQITVTGGVPPYRYTVSTARSAGAKVDDTGKYTAGTTTLEVTDVITITDRDGDGGRATVSIKVTAT